MRKLELNQMESLIGGAEKLKNVDDTSGNKIISRHLKQIKTNMKSKSLILIILSLFIIGNIINFLFFSDNRISTILNVSSICLIIIACFVIKRTN